MSYRTVSTMASCNSLLKVSSNCINRLPQYCRLSFSTTRGDSISSDELFGQVYLLSIKIPSKINQSLSEDHRESLCATKIGFVQGGSYDDVAKRMQQLSTDCPFPYKLEGSYRCKTPQIIESYLHREFKRKWKQGEWFALSSIDKKHISGIMADEIELDKIRYKAENSKKREDVTIAKKVLDPLTGYSRLTKLQKRKVVKAILDKYKPILEQMNLGYRCTLSRDEFEIVTLALEKHPEASLKIGCGLESIFVKEVDFKGLKSCCFHIRRIDGTEEDFSYNYCFGRSVQKSYGYTHAYNQ